MTQVGEGRETGEEIPSPVTFGVPTVGEVLAERYELTEHINDDSAGRQVWRGVDVILRRPVAVVLRYPGGATATAMLQAAVAASRVIHPNLVGVYDAIDEERRAYVVREWIDGKSLRDLVAQGPLDAARATSVAHGVASAMTAIHSTGMVHGNIHPGTVMVGDDGRVMLADARTDGAATQEQDIRAVGGILYFALTGHWPHNEARLPGRSVNGRGRATLPDAVRDASGSAATPRQARAGVPTYLDDLTMDLLDHRLTVPTSDVLTAALSRLDVPVEEQFLDSAGPLRFTSDEGAGGEPALIGNRKTVLGVAGLLVISLIGLLIGIGALSGGGTSDNTSGPAGPGTSTTPDGTATSASPPTTKPRQIALTADQVRAVDPGGDRTELRGIDAVVDGDVENGWDTDSYTAARFGNLKEGMGILIDLGKPREVTNVQVFLSASGASAKLLSGTSAPASSSRNGDKQIVDSFTNEIGVPYEAYDGTQMTFIGFEPGQQYRYLLFWLTELPVVQETGRYKIGVQEITVQGP